MKPLPALRITRSIRDITMHLDMHISRINYAHDVVPHESPYLLDFLGFISHAG